MKIGKLFLTAVTFCSVASLQAQSETQIVAHRGYWKTEGSAQNSIASLEKAIEIGCRGSEIDLILTTDGVLVLHHDDAIAGKRVDASTYAEIKDVKLSNGESLPTFDAFLAVARTRKRRQADHRDQASSDQAEGGCGRPCRAGRRSPCGDDQAGSSISRFRRTFASS